MGGNQVIAGGLEVLKISGMDLRQFLPSTCPSADSGGFSAGRSASQKPRAAASSGDTMRVRMTDQTVTLCVEDNGPGLSPQTVALAGTQAVTESTDVVWQEKEIEEQQLVTDFITQSLSDKVSELTVSSPYSVQAGNLWHIKTDIAATIGSNSNLEEIIKSLHPTSAVCGLPKAAAKDFILQNESYDRSYYSGFLGELNIDLATFRTEQTDLFVNLRCMKINDKHVELFIGCGITKDSVPEAEFIETVNKSMTMRKVLN